MMSMNLTLAELTHWITFKISESELVALETDRQQTRTTTTEWLRKMLCSLPTYNAPIIKASNKS